MDNQLHVFMSKIEDVINKVNLEEFIREWQYEKSCLESDIRSIQFRAPEIVNEIPMRQLMISKVEDLLAARGRSL